MIKQFNSLVDLMIALPNKQASRDQFMAILWRDGAFCSHCSSENVYHFLDGKSHKCGDCRKRFSIKVGTIFEDSEILLIKWFMVIWMLASHPKGIASTQIARDISLTLKTAWFMLHRLWGAAQHSLSISPCLARLKPMKHLLVVKGKTNTKAKSYLLAMAG